MLKPLDKGLDAVTPAKWRVIRISSDVYDEIAKRGKFGESANDVLLKVLRDKRRKS